VHFVTGTDEHGFKIQKAALDKGLPPQEFCDTISQQFRVCFRPDSQLIVFLTQGNL
jgi:methionyl-tRNA synthetase